MDYTKAIEAAAKWWSEQICIAGQDMGAREPTEIMTKMLGIALQARCQPTKDEAEVFRKALIEILTKHAEERDHLWPLGCDYNPDRMLGDAATRAGINHGAFPWKTMMWITADVVKASRGYQVAPAVIWEATKNE